MGASLLADDVAMTSGISTITSVVSQVWTTMTGNPLVMAFVGASLLGVGIGVVRKLTRVKLNFRVQPLGGGASAPSSIFLRKEKTTYEN